MPSAYCIFQREPTNQDGDSIWYWQGIDTHQHLITIQDSSGTTTAYHVGWKGDMHAFHREEGSTHLAIMGSLDITVVPHRSRVLPLPLPFPLRFLIARRGEYLPQFSPVHAIPIPSNHREVDCRSAA